MDSNFWHHHGAQSRPDVIIQVFAHSFVPGHQRDDTACPYHSTLPLPRRFSRTTPLRSRGLLKALKVLAIAHDFLSQHGSTLSFIPSGYDILPAPPPLPVAPSAEDGPAAGPGEQRAAPAPYNHQDEVFTLEVWRRRSLPGRKEVDVVSGHGPPLFDFSLDARREWKNKASVAEDMSYSLADMMYGLLVERPADAGVALPSRPDGSNVSVPLPPGVYSSSYSQQLVSSHGVQLRPSASLAPSPPPSSSSSPPKPSSSSGADRTWSGPVLLSADMAQAPTLFMALILFQQRLQWQGVPLDVVVSVYRNSVAPRLDGRNGFIFKVTAWGRVGGGSFSLEEIGPSCDR